MEPLGFLWFLFIFSSFFPLNVDTSAYRNAVPLFILYSYISACLVILQKDEGSEDEVDDTLTEEKHASDLDNESELVSGEEEFTEEEGSPGTEAAAGSSEQSTEASVRKRKPQGPNSPETT